MKFLLIICLMFSLQAFAGTPVGHIESNVAAAGSGQQISSSNLTVLSAVIQAKPGNTGNVFIGGSTVSSSSYGVVLSPGESLSLSKDALKPSSSGINLAEVYIDAATTSDGVTIFYTSK